MIQPFIDFVHQLFPSIDPYIKEQAKEAMKQFYPYDDTESQDISPEISKLYRGCLLPNNIEYLTQGDIIEELPFIVHDKQGNIYKRNAKGILLSNTCHAENQRFISFAPLLPIKEYKIPKAVLRNNNTNSLLYFPDKALTEYVVDLNLINSYYKDGIIDKLKENRITKFSSLNRFGYYVLLTKLTVFFMRAEDPEVQEYRQALGGI